MPRLSGEVPWYACNCNLFLFFTSSLYYFLLYVSSTTLVVFISIFEYVIKDFSWNTSSCKNSHVHCVLFEFLLLYYHYHRYQRLLRKWQGELTGVTLTFWWWICLLALVMSRYLCLRTCNYQVVNNFVIRKVVLVRSFFGGSNFGDQLGPLHWLAVCILVFEILVCLIIAINLILRRLC